jgi:FKBP-type peptidyl-prolyl cis-trans isomerase
VGTDKRERQKAARYAKISQETAAAKKQRTFHTVRNLGIAAVVILGGAFAYSTVFSDDDSSASDETEGEDTTTTLGEVTTTTVPFSNPELAAAVLEREPPDPAPPPADTAADVLDVSTVIEGEGEPGTAEDGYVVHYVGKKPDGTVLDESWTKEPFPIAAPLGGASLIDGWKEGLVGAKVGERRRLVIGETKAYAGEGPLAFEIDVVDITPAG